MAGHFSPKSFFLQAPNALLREYFESTGIHADIRWDSLADRDVEPLLLLYDGAPESVRCDMDTDFRRVQELADEGGVSTLVEVAGWHDSGADLRREVQNVSGHLDFAFIAFLRYRDIFEEAGDFHYADSLGHWRKRKNLPDKEPDTSEHAEGRLRDAIGEHYQQTERRGFGCDVEHRKRDRRHYWFVRLEDYATKTLTYDESHRLQTGTLRPAFDLIFLHAPAEQTLDVFVKGSRNKLVALQKIWAEVILGRDPGDPPADSQVYQLDLLKSRDFHFTWNPADGIAEVQLRRLKIRVLDTKAQLTLEVPNGAPPSEMHDLLEKVRSGLDVFPELLVVTSAGFRIEFVPEKSGRPRRLSFTVGAPNSCSLRCDPKHETAKSLLKRWGLDVTGTSEPDSGDAGTSAQRIPDR